MYKNEVSACAFKKQFGDSAFSLSRIALDQDSLCKVSGNEVSIYSKQNLPNVNSEQGVQKVILWLLKNGLCDETTLRKYKEKRDRHREYCREQRRKKIYEKLAIVRNQPVNTSKEFFVAPAPTNFKIQTTRSIVNLADINIKNIESSSEKIYKIDLEGKWMEYQRPKRKRIIRKRDKILREFWKRSYVAPKIITIKKANDNQVFQVESEGEKPLDNCKRSVYTEVASKTNSINSSEVACVGSEERVATVNNRPKAGWDSGGEIHGLKKCVVQTFNCTEQTYSNNFVGHSNETINLFTARNFRHGAQLVDKSTSTTSLMARLRAEHRMKRTKNAQSSTKKKKDNIDEYADSIKSILTRHRETSHDAHTQVSIHLALNDLYTLRWINCYLFSTDLLAQYHIIIDDKERADSEIATVGSVY